MTDALLETTTLSRSFQVKTAPFSARQYLKAVEGVNLSIASGEALGLAGESGCGKSTLAKLLCGLLPPTSGTVHYKGDALQGMTKPQLSIFRKEVQMIFQDPFSSLNPRMRVGDIIGEPLLIHRIARGEERRERVTQLMARVGLSPEQFHRYPHEFSGGQRQRIGIARALAVSPRLIIADEPVSALDLSIQAQIINLLQELQEEFSLSFLFITHDLSVIRHMCDRIAIMYLGRIVETGSREQVLDHFLHPYTEALLSAVPRINKKSTVQRLILKGDIPSPLTPPPGCPFHPRCPHAKPICHTEPPPLETKEDNHLAACHFSASLYR